MLPPLHFRFPYLSFSSAPQVNCFDQLASAPDLNEKWEEHLKTLVGLLNRSPLQVEVKKRLQFLFEKLSLDNLEIFFKEFSTKPNAEELLLLSLEAKSLTEWMNKFPEEGKSLQKQVQAIMERLPIPDITAIAPKDKSHAGEVITRFFPNLTRTFFKAFDLFDSTRPPETLYEYGVLVSLYFHFFKIPYFLVATVSAFVENSLQVALFSTLVIGMAVGLLYTYLRYFRQCPEHVIHCDNLSLRCPKKVLCREREYEEAISCLGSNLNLAVVGEPGVGKTAWMDGLPQRLPHKKVFAFNNNQLFGAHAFSTSPASKVEEAFREVRFHEEKVLFCLDEFGDAFKAKPEDMLTIIKQVLERKNISLIVMIQKDQWEELCKRDKSIEERFTKIEMVPTKDLQTERILLDEVQRHDISVKPLAIRKIVQLTNKDKDHCQPRNGWNHLKVLINKVEQFNPATYTTARWRQVNDSLENARIFGCDQEFTEAKKEEKEAREDMEKCRVKGAECLHLLRHQRFFQKQVRSAASKGNTTRFLFTHHFALPLLEKWVEEKVRDLPKDMSVRIDEERICLNR